MNEWAQHYCFVKMDDGTYQAELDEAWWWGGGHNDGGTIRTPVPEEWFADMVGVTRSPDDVPERVVVWASPSEAPYIRTKPLHHSQRILEDRDDGSAVFELRVIVNRELVRLLFGFAEGIRVLRPRKLVHVMRRHFLLGAGLYGTDGASPDGNPSADRVSTAPPERAPST